jgi:hypothetical protein
MELAPLKRFTDLAMHSMFRVSDLHNKKLQGTYCCYYFGIASAAYKKSKKIVGTI